jgi:aspartate-semialdehyde dehydrogenase
MNFAAAAGALTLLGSLSTGHGFAPARRPLLSSRATSLAMAAAPLTVGVVGATGAVGKEIVGCLEKRAFPASALRIFGSPRSAGKEISTKFGDIIVGLFDEASAQQYDVVFLAVDGAFSLAHAERLCAGDNGPVVINNSSTFRFVDGIPLVVPEINTECTVG